MLTNGKKFKDEHASGSNQPHSENLLSIRLDLKSETVRNDLQNKNLENLQNKECQIYIHTSKMVRCQLRWVH